MVIEIEVRRRGQSLKRYELFIVFRLQRIQDQKHGSPLGMSNVVHLGLSCLLQDVVNERWDIIKADLFPAELPEVRVEAAIRVEGEMVAGVEVSSGVA